MSVTGAFGGGSEIGAADPDDGVLDATDAARGLAPGARPPRLGPAPRHDRRAARRLPRPRHAWSRSTCHRGREFNVDGEMRDDGMQRITVEHDAFELVVG